MKPAGRHSLKQSGSCMPPNPALPTWAGANIHPFPASMHLQQRIPRIANPQIPRKWDTAPSLRLHQHAQNFWSHETRDEGPPFVVVPPLLVSLDQHNRVKTLELHNCDSQVVLRIYTMCMSSHLKRGKDMYHICTECMSSEWLLRLRVSWHIMHREMRVKAGKMTPPAESDDLCMVISCNSITARTGRAIQSRLITLRELGFYTPGE